MVNRKDLIVCFVLRFVAGLGLLYMWLFRMLSGWVKPDIFDILYVLLGLAIVIESAYTGLKLYKLQKRARDDAQVGVFTDRVLSVDRIVIAAAFLLAAACCVPDIVEHGLQSSYTVLAVLAIALGAIFFYAEGKARSNSEET